MRKPGPRKLAREELLQYALRALGARALSAGEVRSKLARRAAEPSDIDGIMEQLKEYGFLNDRQFAESFAVIRRDSGTAGRQRVVRDLRNRRVGGALAEQAVAGAFDNTDEPAMVRHYLERRLRSKNLREYFTEEKHLISAYRKLRYAGFSSSSITKVLKEYTARAAELEEIEDPAATDE